jgi:hypothetical protein
MANRSFTLEAKCMTSIRSLMLAPGWRVTEVGQINDKGQIAATGTFREQTATYALLLNPVNTQSHLP